MNEELYKTVDGEFTCEECQYFDERITGSDYYGFCKRKNIFVHMREAGFCEDCCSMERIPHETVGVCELYGKYLCNIRPCKEFKERRF